jgi:hypothetical protein
MLDDNLIIYFILHFFSGMLLHHVQGRQIRESQHNRFEVNQKNGGHSHSGHQYGSGHSHSHQHHHQHGSSIHSIHNVANPHQYTSYEEFQRAMENPFENNNTGTNITVPLGDTAFLRCKVRNLGERSVSLDPFFCMHLYDKDYNFLRKTKTINKKVLLHSKISKY